MANRRNFLKQQLLPQQLLQYHAFKGTRETEDIAKPRKLTNQLYFNLNFGKQMCCLGCFKIMGKLDAVEAGVKFRS
jgi:hypothetical protein